VTTATARCAAFRLVRRACRRRRRIDLRVVTGFFLILALLAGGIEMYRPYRLPLVIGAVPYWDLADSAQSVSDHSHVIDVATPWWYGLATDGSVVSQLPAGDTVQTLTRLHATTVRLVPTVADTTEGAWAPAVAQAILHDQMRRRAHVADLATLASTHGFTGLQLDYEDLTAADRDIFSQFVAELAEALHARRKVLYVTVHPKTNDAGYNQRNLAQDYAAIGRSADRVCVMAYDWHWQSSAAGPIAPLWWVDDVLRYATSVIPAKKLILGVGLYGYDWVGQQGQDILWQQADTLARSPGVTAGWDAPSSSPHLRYDRDGVHHEVWYEDARSITRKLELAVEYQLSGAELWRLGAEDPAIWAPLADRHRPPS
jgi:spore germination protein YaaH